MTDEISNANANDENANLAPIHVDIYYTWNIINKETHDVLTWKSHETIVDARAMTVEQIGRRVNSRHVTQEAFLRHTHPGCILEPHTPRVEIISEQKLAIRQRLNAYSADRN